MTDHQLKEIEQYRQRINEIDKQLFELAKQREQLSAHIGQAKRDLNIADKDFGREKAVFERALQFAHSLELPENFVIQLQTLMMELSLQRQEKDRIKHFSKAPLTTTVIGGAGRLGSWLCRFFADSGHDIHVIDQQQPKFPCHYTQHITDEITNSELIVVATPIRESAHLLQELSKLPIQKSVIFDVSSVKAPVKQSLSLLQQQGIKVTSLHPMFGPSVEILFGKHIIITSVGNESADQFAKDLFKSTSLNIVSMSIDEHDHIISYLLSLSHIINILFILTLEKSGLASSTLSGFSSPTFSHLLNNARKVFHENPHLYYEIQALNPHNRDVYAALSSTLDELENTIKAHDENTFVEFMKKGLDYLRKTS